MGATSFCLVAGGLGGMSGAGSEPGGRGAGRTGSRGANVSCWRAGRDADPEPVCTPHGKGKDTIVL